MISGEEFRKRYASGKYITYKLLDEQLSDGSIIFQNGLNESTTINIRINYFDAILHNVNKALTDNHWIVSAYIPDDATVDISNEHECITNKVILNFDELITTDDFANYAYTYLHDFLLKYKANKQQHIE